MKHDRAPSAEQVRAAIIEALVAVSGDLPASAREALAVAVRASDLKENEISRVALWRQLDGVEQQSSADVLAIRLVICALHPQSLVADTQTSIEYFVDTYRAAGFPEGALAGVAALEARYHEA